MTELPSLRTAAALLAAVLALGGMSGCSNDDAESNTTTAVTPTSASGSGPTLPFDDSPAKSEIEQGAGLRFPAGAREFRSVATFPGRQLDVTFLMPPDQVDAFTTGSTLAPPAEGEQVLPHGSPLWDREVPAGVRLRGSLTRRDSLLIATELVDEAPHATRVRLSISATDESSGASGVSGATGPTGG